MKILIDIGHPGHVHLFKNFTWEMQKKGHKIFFTCRDKEFETDLLKRYGFKYKSFGKKYKKLIGKVFGLVKFDVQMILTAIDFKPDIFLSHGSMYAAHASFFFKKPHISFEDTFNMEQVKLYEPFSEAILIHRFPTLPFQSKKIIEYDGYHELAYLHPNWFKANPNIYQVLNLQKGDRYILLRFVSWDATHDKGQTGLTLEYKIKLVEALSKYAKVFISSEGELPKKLKKYQIQVSPEQIHDVMNFASLFIGEGATMASECAVLGTVSIYVNTLNPLTIQEQEKYGLLYNYRNADNILEKGIEILCNEKIQEEHEENKVQMLLEQIDVTAFMIWFVENYPKSLEIVKKDSNCQQRFK